MTFEQVMDLWARFAVETKLLAEYSRAVVTDWLGGEEALADDVRIVLASANLGREVTTAVLWLTTRHDLDILCVRAAPYELDGRLLLNIQQVIPLPAARDYQIQLRPKEKRTRIAITADDKDRTQYRLLVDGQAQEPMSKQGAIHDRGRSVATGTGSPREPCRPTFFGLDEAVDRAVRCAAAGLR